MGDEHDDKVLERIATALERIADSLAPLAQIAGDTASIEVDLNIIDRSIKDIAVVLGQPKRALKRLAILFSVASVKSRVMRR
jgi:hypothetical protein